MNSAVKKNLPSVLLTAVVIAAVVMINAIVFTLASTFGWYLYSQPVDDLSISDSGDQLFSEAMKLGKKVDVTFCMYEDELAAHPTGAFVLTTAKAFAEKYPQLITLNFVNIITKLDSDGNEYDVTKYQTDIQGNENKILKTSVIFECDDGNYRVLTDSYTATGFADFYTLDSSNSITSYNGEEMFASMVHWVLTPEHGTAYVVIGHGETSTLPMRSVLTSAGYYVKELDLKKGEIPEDAALLVISNPRNDFEQAAEGSALRTEIERMRTFAEKGGHFLITLDPVSRNLPVLEGFLGEFGIGFERTEGGDRQTVKDPDNAITTDGFTLVATYADSPVADAVRTNADGGIIIRSVAAVSTTGNAKPLLISSGSSECYADGKITDSRGGYTVAAYSTVPHEDGEARMIFIPSVYIAAADAIITNGYSNKDFLYSVFDEYFEAGEMPYGCNSVVTATGLLENLTMGTIRIYTALIMAVPAALAVVGAVVIVRRKNR